MGSHTDVDQLEKPMSDDKDRLVSSEEDGILTIRCRYSWLDKVVGVSEEGQVTATFG